GALQALDCPYEAAQARRDGGDLRGAYQLFRDLGAARDREETAEALRRGGRRIPRRDRSRRDDTGLSETERRICGLVAKGGGNEAIADSLVISVRTVETHLTNIYRKTGCRGRAALAAWWVTRAASN